MDFPQAPKNHDFALYEEPCVLDNVDMPDERSDNHLKAWRKFRRMTQQELADAVEPPTTKQVIQAIESGARGLSDKWLRRLAPALGTTPGYLLDHQPQDIDSELVEAAQEVAKGNREQVLQILRTFRTGTNG